MIAVVDGAPMGYDDVGRGLPVVFIHGFPLDRALWQPQLGALVDRCRCVAPDLRGFGETPARAPYSMDRYADDVAALLDVLGIERAVIAGMSMGGYVALAFWRRHRERVRALLLTDTRATADTPAGREGRRAVIALARERGSVGVAEKLIQTLVGETTKRQRPEIVAALRAMLERASVDAIVGASEAMLDRPDSTPTLATIDVPTLIVVGDEDVLTPPADADALRRGIAGSRLETIAGAGHASNFERPAAFNHLVSEFVAQLTYA